MNAGLSESLDDLKSILLLGRGELYHTLLGTAANMLDGPPNMAASKSSVVFLLLLVTN